MVRDRRRAAGGDAQEAPRGRSSRRPTSSTGSSPARWTCRPRTRPSSRACGGSRPTAASRSQVARLGAGGAPEAPYFDRRFMPGETDDVRALPARRRRPRRGRGAAGGIKVRVIGGKGNDLLDDAKAGGTRSTTRSATTRSSRDPARPGTSGPTAAPPGPKGAPWIPPRDWGRDWFLGPLGRATARTTASSSAAASRRSATASAGTRGPSQQTLRAGWAFGAQQPKVDYGGEFHTRRLGLPLGAACATTRASRSCATTASATRPGRRGRRLLQGAPAADGVRPEPDAGRSPSRSTSRWRPRCSTRRPRSRPATSSTRRSRTATGDFGQVGGLGAAAARHARGMNRTAGGRRPCRPASAPPATR